MVSLKAIYGNSTDLITIGKDGATFQRNSAPSITLPMEIKKSANP